MEYNSIPVSFKNLLDDMSQILGMQLPLYGSNFVNRRYEAWVELIPSRMRFSGLPTLTRIGSEQVAARAAIDYLRDAYRVEIIDFNFREQRETCVQVQLLQTQVTQLRNQIAHVRNQNLTLQHQVQNLEHPLATEEVIVISDDEDNDNFDPDYEPSMDIETGDEA